MTLPAGSDEQTLLVQHPADLHRVRRAARDAAERAGFGVHGTERIVLAAMELAANLLRYAGGGVIELRDVVDAARGSGLEITATDTGPGIADVARALEDGFSTGGGLGGGLPGVRRLLDEFEIESSAAGTRAVGRQWLARS